MPCFGVHESISGGVENAVYAAAAHGFDCVQIFSKNSNRWVAKPLEPKSAQKFQDAMTQTGLVSPLIHDSYLINLASPEAEQLEKSRAAFTDELVRADVLGVPNVVMHPGAAKEDTRENGLRRVAESLDGIFASLPETNRVRVLLETTAGQGTYLGSRFEELAQIIDFSSFKDRLGVCFDTCHAFAAGYDFGTPEKYDAVFADFDRIVGLDRLCAFHLNDSVKGLGSKVDRHAHIGRGALGLEPFRFIVNDPRFADLPMYLETPKGETDEGDWDVVNLKTLRDLIK